MIRSSLDAYCDNIPMGVLSVADGFWSFSYNDLWLRAEIYQPALSPLFPKRSAAYQDTLHSRTVQHHFENMLPSGRLLEQLMQARGLDNSFDLLASMGHDLPGVVSLKAPASKNVVPQTLPGRIATGAYPNLDQLPQLLKRAGVAPGSQLKLAADVAGTVLSTLDHGQPSRVIIKTGSDNQDGTCHPEILNEWFCTRLIQALGFSTSYMEVSRLFGGSLIIRRFDRMRNDDALERKPVINGCQALGVRQDESHELLTGSALYALAHLTERPPRALRRLFAWACLNITIGNSETDLADLAFALSVNQTRETELKALPFYDLSSQFNAYSRTHSALFGGKPLEDLELDDIMALAGEMRYDQERARADLYDILNATALALPDMMGLLEQEVRMHPAWESISLGAPECKYLASLQTSIQHQTDRLLASNW